MQSTFGLEMTTLSYAMYSQKAEEESIKALTSYFNMHPEYLGQYEIVNLAKKLFNRDDGKFKLHAAKGGMSYYYDWNDHSSNMSLTSNIFKELFDITVKLEKTHSKPGYLIDGKSDYRILLPASNPFVFLMPDMKLTIPKKINDPYLTDIYHSGKYADITLNIEGHLIQAHRVILGKNPYFEALFNFSSSSGNTNVFIIPDITFATAHAILKYLYTGETDNQFLSNSPNCLNLLCQCERFQQKELGQIAKFHLFAQKDTEFFIHVAIASLILNDEEVNCYCTRFFQAFPGYSNNLDLTQCNKALLEQVASVGKKFKIKQLSEAAEAALNFNS